MPSVLIETGFITNTSEGAYLSSANGQKKIASAITNAIKNYKSSLNLNAFEVISDNETVAVASDIYEDVVFKVQIAASSKKLEPKSYNFKGLNQISRSKENTLYKYYFGETSDYLKVQELVKQAKNVGYDQAYVVAFRNQQKISVSEALKSKLN